MGRSEGNGERKMCACETEKVETTLVFIVYHILQIISTSLLCLILYRHKGTIV